MSSGRTVLDGPASSATRTVTEPTTLGDEHAALVQAVHRRADAALALIDAQVGPAAEVETLARFLHTAVLRQASDEEVLPYPPRGLGARCRADGRPRLPARARRAPRPRRGLSLLSEPPATAAVAAGSRSWLPAGREPVYIALGPAPTEDAVQACIERLLRLRQGERAEVRSDHDDGLQQICQWLHHFDAAGYGLEHLRAGTADATLRVTRRDPA